MFRAIKTFLGSRTGRLTLTYLAIIVGMTMLFSAVIFSISSAQFDRPPRPEFLNFGYEESVASSIEDVFRRRASEAKTGLLWSLGALNLISLLAGAVFSRFLAKWTLRPIEAAMDAQTQFVSDASHELRTPLTALQTTNEVALRRKKLTLAEAKKVLQQNVNETEKLRDLSNALLGLVNQERAKKTTQNMRLSDLIEDVMQVIAPQSIAKQISIRDNTGKTMIKSNKTALTQILKILLENAVKYSPKKSTVEIRAITAGDHVAIAVQDWGRGIARVDQTKIFDRFYRVDSSRSTQHEEGSGLGLAIAKTIANRQDMKLSVESKLGEGSIFTVTVKKGR